MYFQYTCKRTISMQRFKLAAGDANDADWARNLCQELIDTYCLMSRDNNEERGIVGVWCEHSIAGVDFENTTTVVNSYIFPLHCNGTCLVDKSSL